MNGVDFHCAIFSQSFGKSKHVIGRNPLFSLFRGGVTVKTSPLGNASWWKVIYMLAPRWGMQETVVEQLVLMRDFSNKRFELKVVGLKTGRYFDVHGHGARPPRCTNRDLLGPRPAHSNGM